jgi:Domain of unknown function (DUF362)
MLNDELTGGGRAQHHRQNVDSSVVNAGIGETAALPDGASRREFLAGSAAVIGATLAAPAFAAGPTSKSRIVQAEHSGVTTGPTTIDADVLKTLIDAALCRYAGTKSAVEAVRKYFKKGQKVAIKVNTLGSPYSSVNPETAAHLGDLLHESGIPKDDIRVFDQYISRMQTGRFRVRRSPGSIWVTNHLGRDPKLQEYRDGDYRVEFHWEKLIVWADAVLNVCVPKDHDLTGVTGAMKNMAMGVVKPTTEREANKANPGHYTVVPKFHRGNCDPAIPWLYSQPMIRDKVKLILVDGVRLLYHGGPQDKARHRQLLNQIWVAEDPVAVDATILTLVNKVRKAKGMKPVEEDLFRDKPRLPKYIATAAKMGLGTNDAARITLDHFKVG